MADWSDDDGFEGEGQKFQEEVGAGDLRQMFSSGFQQLHHLRDWETAVLRGTPARVRQILDEGGAEVDAALSNGQAPLFAAARKGRSDVCAVLLDHHAQVNGEDGEDGWTPLHAAVACGDGGTCRLLLDRGANITSKDKDGKTPADIARVFGRDHLVFLLGPKKTDRGPKKTASSLKLEQALAFLETACDSGADTADSIEQDLSEDEDSLEEGVSREHFGVGEGGDGKGWAEEQARIAKLEYLHPSLVNKNNNLEQKHKKVEEQCVQLARQHEELLERHNELSQRHSQLQREHASLGGKYNNLERRHGQLAQHVSGLVGQYSALVSKVEGLEADFLKKQEELHFKNNDLAEEHEELELRVRYLEMQLSNEGAK